VLTAWRRRHAALPLAWAMLLCLGAQAQSTKPRLPPGRDTGGALLGLMTSGIDYRRPEIAGCLARDGEGELIGWDMVDRDRAPFRADATGDVDVFASLPCDRRLRVAPVRVDPADGLTHAKALAFFSTAEARVVLIPQASRPLDWSALRLAAAQFGQLRIVVAGAPLPPEFAGLANVAAVPVEGAVSRAVQMLLCEGAGCR
jgi:hypothetical protein